MTQTGCPYPLNRDLFLFYSLKFTLSAEILDRLPIIPPLLEQRDPTPLSSPPLDYNTITRNDRTFGCPIICTYTNSQCYIVH